MRRPELVFLTVLGGLLSLFAGVGLGKALDQRNRNSCATVSAWPGSAHSVEFGWNWPPPHKSGAVTIILTDHPVLSGPANRTFVTKSLSGRDIKGPNASPQRILVPDWIQGTAEGACGELTADGWRPVSCRHFGQSPIRKNAAGRTP